MPAQRESNCQKYLDLEHFGLTHTKTNGEQSVMENHTILCQYRYGTVHLCSGKINKYLSGSNRERSIGEGMAVPELRTRFFKKLVRKSLNTVCIKIPIHSRHKCCALLILVIWYAH